MVFKIVFEPSKALFTITSLIVANLTIEFFAFWLAFKCFSVNNVPSSTLTTHSFFIACDTVGSFAIFVADVQICIQSESLIAFNALEQFAIKTVIDFTLI